jgi:hypothetical protein
MIPSHRESMPVNPRDISKAVLERVNIAVIICEKICKSPSTINLNRAVIKALIEEKNPD